MLDGGDEQGLVFTNLSFIDVNQKLYRIAGPTIINVSDTTTDNRIIQYLPGSYSLLNKMNLFKVGLIATISVLVLDRVSQTPKRLLAAIR